MDIEITTIERSSDEPHHYDEANTISKTSRQEAVPDNDDESLEIFNDNSKRWYVFSLSILLSYFLHEKVLFVYETIYHTLFYVCYIHKHCHGCWNIDCLFYFTQIKYVFHLLLPSK